MLTILNSWFRIVPDGPASGTYDLIDPPVVANDIDFSDGREQRSRGGIKHHGISATNALHDCVLETWGFCKEWRETKMATRYIHYLSSRAIDGRQLVRDRRQPIQRSLQLVFIPDVILVTEGEVIPHNIERTSKRHEIARKSALRTAAQCDRILQASAEPSNNVARSIRRTVVRDVQRPVCVRLINERLQLFRQITFAVPGAHQNSNPRTAGVSGIQLRATVNHLLN